MADDTPPTIVQRFFRACLLILGGIVALWLALELLAQFWGWILMISVLALVLCAAVRAYRYWWGQR
ncbi:hypothetical protein PYV02_06705 [Leifsonia sp. H3M29-4]|uniref:hypothetical protein n=1 Tax=Salinibacterium metalliresistens TaxID=3031321 RepID=UPI0023DAD9AB|nr:hypothetical protein [Salinibacterium metalliresistens]MDF1478773.1 hypothetical protein [Salinibacterium metalliresistens]